MSIETVCAGCRLALRVADEHQGKQARCPSCGQIYTIPLIGGGAFDDRCVVAVPVEAEDADGIEFADKSFAGDANAERVWFMKTPEGQTYGPVTRADLDRWMSEGRIAADCDLRVGNRGWMSADQLFPSLRPVVTRTRTSAASASETRHAPAARSGGSAPTMTHVHFVTATPGGSPPFTAHRGGLVLGLGISGLITGLLFACPILSIMAWVMGNGDLREMRAGRMDPAGEALTQTGQIMGMVVSLMWITLSVIALFLSLVLAASNM